MNVVNKHLEFYNDTIFNKKWVLEHYKSITESENLRWGLWLFIVILMYVSYFQSLQRLSKKKIIYKFNYKHLYFIIFSLLQTFNFLFFLYLWDKIPLFTIPKKIWLLGVLALLIFVNYKIYSTYNTVKKNNTFNTPPKFYQKLTRTIINVIILILLLVQFFLEYKTHISSDVTNEFKNKYITSRFGGIKNKKIFMCGWSKVIQIIFQISILIITINYYPCKYNLPDSWHF